MKIYVSHASNGVAYEERLYDPIRRSALSKDHTFVLPHEAKEFHSKEVIASCDLVVAEVSVPSTGVGIELGWANAAGVPIVALHDRGTSPSPSVRRVARAVIAYSGDDDVERAIASALST